jgi:hypothetical protein
MWNYRVIDIQEGEEPWLEVSEVYYDTLGKPMGYCKATVGGGTIDEVKETLKMMASALDKPVLKFREPVKKQLELDLRHTIDSALDSLKAACGVAPKYKILDDGAVYFYMDEVNG